MEKELADISKTLHTLFERYKRENGLSVSKFNETIDRVTSTITTQIDSIKYSIEVDRAEGLSVALIQDEAKLEMLLYLKNELSEWDMLINESFKMIDNDDE